MLLTTSLLSKSSFLGSLLSKCRPAAAASFSSPSAGLKTLEEQVGLPPRPKKPLTPYFRFMREMRPKVAADNPHISTLDCVRIMSKKWETAEPSLKLKLQDEYKKDQQKFVETRAKYESQITEEQRNEIKQMKQDIVDAKERRMLRRRVKELGRPRKPASAYLRFISAERKSTPQLPSQTYRNWHRQVTDKWTCMTDEEKAVYMQESRKELDVYKQQITVWEEKMIRQGHVDVVRHSNLIDPPEPKQRKESTKL